ncbi:MAG: GNAT family N-acetyltransferase [Bdellovibrionales bacterium]|jgi:hypothetical protein|nr:GNAT family N-acetyltransferase [Bdellovibrionales bacterium]
MKLTNDDVRSFAQEELNTFDLSNIELDTNLALKELRDEIVSEWDELNSSEVMDSRNNYFEVSNTKSSDYAEKLFELSGDKKVIYGIRHMGGNKELPFINLKPNFVISSSKEALEIYEKVKDEFTAFSPLYLSFWSPKKIEVDFIGSTYLVARSKDIKEMEPWENEGSLEFKKVVDDSYYDWYKSGYEEFYKERPDLEKKVTMNSLDSMRDSVEQGLMYEVYFDGEKIGLIAGESSPLLGHAGLYFHEIFISKDWKGKGLAKAIQRKFVEQCTKDNDFIWGTVDNHNLPSYKTALSNNRVPIRFECFMKI